MLTHMLVSTSVTDGCIDTLPSCIILLLIHLHMCGKMRGTSHSWSGQLHHGQLHHGTMQGLHRLTLLVHLAVCHSTAETFH